MENSSEIFNLGYVLIGKNLQVKRNVNIEISDNKIVHIGNGFDSNGKDYRNAILMPTLVNAHVHTGDFSFPEIGIDKPIGDLVSDPKSIKYKFFNKLKFIYIKRYIKDFLEYSKKFGIFTIIDFREQDIFGAKLAKEVKDELANELNYIILSRLDKEINEIRLKTLYELSDGYGISSSTTYNKEDLIKIDKFFHNKIIAIHISETLKQGLQNDLSYTLKVIRPKIIIHGTHLFKEDFLELKDRNISLVSCPRSNLWFSNGIPRIEEIIDSKVNLLIGTDNGAWIDPNIWKDMELALLITRLRKPLSNYSKEILKAATTNISEILFKNYINEGLPARFIIIEGEKSGIFRSHDIYQAIIKRGYNILYSRFTF